MAIGVPCKWRRQVFTSRRHRVSVNSICEPFGRAAQMAPSGASVCVQRLLVRANKGTVQLRFAAVDRRLALRSSGTWPLPNGA